MSEKEYTEEVTLSVNDFDNSINFIEDTDLIQQNDIDEQSSTTSSIISTEKVRNYKVAKIWLYFDKNTSQHPNHPVCKSCGNVFSKKTGNSSLQQHLETKHGINVEKVMETKQTRFSFHNISLHLPKDQEDRNKVVVTWIIMNQQPFSIVEDKYFQEMIRTFDPKYKFPSQIYIKEM
ncbi:15421_t:CDS:1, partial [Acaulospora morrowiae]